MTAEDEFDVFLCHNSQDKPEVKEIANQLKATGISPWLDEWELRPGLPWQVLLEQQIVNIKSAAVFVGSSGLGPWQEQELRGFLSEFVSRKCPVIPVLLSNAPEQPQLPIFLRAMTWVDFRKVDSEPMKLLIWGITGVKPKQGDNKGVSGLANNNADRRKGEAEYRREDLGNGVTLDLVSIPSGKFQMGSPPTESGRNTSESPQHQVTVPAFWIGIYAITQAQWKIVASWAKVKNDLNAGPSSFKGANRPVENISWDNAVEFCARLSKQLGREYRLPSEAEWEYACRAGTKTPFYFGETITTDLANYNGNYTYGSGPEGQYRGETTEVGSFPPNAFGLYDMHGNVREWCQDQWHENYQGAPTDGSAWVTGDAAYRVLRGGSCGNVPWDCRSAGRLRLFPGFVDYYGFRVVCFSAWT